MTLCADGTFALPTTHTHTPSALQTPHAPPKTYSQTTFDSNAATGGGGGAVAVATATWGSVSLNMSFITFSGNQAAGGGSAVSANAAAGISNSAFNCPGAPATPCVTGSGPITLRRCMLPGGWAGAGAGNADVTNLLLASLANNGGPARSRRPLPGRPVLDAADASLLTADDTTDQRGFPRVACGAPDIGAVEGGA